jgi:hypothetical protein
MIKAWFLFFLGTLAFFLYKYINRSNKEAFSIKFWIQDNWPELLLTFTFDLAAVVVFLDNSTVIDLTKIEWFPAWLSLPVNLVAAFFMGYGGGAAIYKLLEKKVSDSKADAKG